jgi:histidinol-phosphate/aromatic aminotransferase/cobyric acid decarboxylase-like protein
MYPSIHPKTLIVVPRATIGQLILTSFGMLSALPRHNGVTFMSYRRAVTPRTKMIIVNTPHNPLGKVFTREELENIAAIAEEFNLLVMSDEVVRIHQCSVIYRS